jgi:hypothetical protein
MQIQVKRGALSVVLGSRLGVSDVERINEAISTLGPFNSATLDISSAHARHDDEWVLIAKLVNSLPVGQSTVLGLTMGQSQELLKYLDEVPLSLAA